jgi:hypothetical protein
MEAIDFFRMSEGQWISQRTTHHLAMRRTELGQLIITTAMLEADDPQVVEICQLHQVETAQAIGGLTVTWEGSMEWDEAGKTQAGATVLVLVPEAPGAQRGRLLREKGYAETSPTVGEYFVDNQNGLVLLTDYSTMSSVERFWFPHEGMRLRTSTVIGLSNTASFCVETRLATEETPVSATSSAAVASLPKAHFSALGW